MIDTTRTIDIARAPEKLFLLLVFGVAMTAGSGALALMPDGDTFVRALGLIGLVVFAVCTLAAARELLGPSGPVITLSPQGIRDTRIAAETIPWSAVTDVSTLKYRYSRSVALAIKPAVAARLTFPLIVRCTRPINRAFGYDEIPISATSARTDFATLMALTMAYWQAWRGQQKH